LYDIVIKEVEAVMTCYSGQEDLEYYPSGIIKSYVTLVSDEFQISGQFIKVAERTKITFYPNGNIQSFFLADDAKLKSGRLSKAFFQNEKVEVLEDGTLNLAAEESSFNGEPETKNTFLDAARSLFRF
jgi:hypothetical protein